MHEFFHEIRILIHLFIIRLRIEVSFDFVQKHQSWHGKLWFMLISRRQTVWQFDCHIHSNRFTKICMGFESCCLPNIFWIQKDLFILRFLLILIHEQIYIDAFWWNEINRIAWFAFVVTVFANIGEMTAMDWHLHRRTSYLIDLLAFDFHEWMWFDRHWK